MQHSANENVMYTASAVCEKRLCSPVGAPAAPSRVMWVEAIPWAYPKAAPTRLGGCPRARAVRAPKSRPPGAPSRCVGCQKCFYCRRRLQASFRMLPTPPM